MRNALVAICLIALLSGGCARDKYVIEYDLPAEFPGEAVSNPFSLGNNQVPLPAGGWVLIAKDVYDGNTGWWHPHFDGENGVYGGVILMELNNGKLARLVDIRTIVGGSDKIGGPHRAPICSRKDLHHRITVSNEVRGPLDCWWVTHSRMRADSSTTQLRRRAFDFLTSRNIPIPEIMMSVGYLLARKGPPQNHLWVLHFWNPEQVGFSPPQPVTWAKSEWNSIRAFSDPRKRNYIEKLKAWGAAWYKTVKAGFDTLTVNPLKTECLDEQGPAHSSSDCIEWRKAFEERFQELKLGSEPTS